MFDVFERGWRVVATGACFVVFGLGGLLLGIAVFPLMRLVVPAGPRRLQAARGLIHHLFRSFVELMRLTRVLSVEIHGVDKLRGGGQLILANHPTLIDVVLLMSLVRRCDCIVKGSLGRNPFTRGPVLAAAYVLNDGAGQMIDDCVRSVRGGNNLIIFPEGTRSSVSQPMRLHRGAARVAVHGAIDITPIRIHCSPRILAKGQKWYAVPHRRAHIRIDVDDPIAVSAFLAGAPSHALATRRLNQHLTDYFSREHMHASA